jgi:hypothetical protein
MQTDYEGLVLKYFVLKPKAKSKKDSYAFAAQCALFTYADMIEEENEVLANDIRRWTGSEVAKQVNLDE